MQFSERWLNQSPPSIRLVKGLTLVSLIASGDIRIRLTHFRMAAKLAILALIFCGPWIALVIPTTDFAYFVLAGVVIRLVLRSQPQVMASLMALALIWLGASVFDALAAALAASSLTLFYSALLALRQQSRFLAEGVYLLPPKQITIYFSGLVISGAAFLFSFELFHDHWVSVILLFAIALGLAHKRSAPLFVQGLMSVFGLHARSIGEKRGQQNTLLNALIFAVLSIVLALTRGEHFIAVFAALMLAQFIAAPLLSLGRHKSWFTQTPNSSNEI